MSLVRPLPTAPEVANLAADDPVRALERLRAPASRLGQLLIDKGLVTPQQLQEVLIRQKTSGDRMGTCLLNMGLIDEETLAQTLSEQFRVPHVNLEQVVPDPEMTRLVPKKLAQQCQAIPLSRRGSRLRVATLDPSNLAVLEELKFATGLDIEVFVAPESQIRHGIQKLYDDPQETSESASEDAVYETYGRLVQADGLDAAVEVIDEGTQTVDVRELETMSGEDRVVDLANLILADAVRKKVSDIHLEPYDRQFRLRFRIDGELVTVMNLPFGIKDALTSRLKIMSRLNIAERRVPQDGRIRLNVRLDDGVKETDFRVSTLPTLFGEKIVMRLLDKGNLMFDMSCLGFDARSLEKLQKAIHKPFGLILVTGPTGSGKTNTLYSAISQINQPDVNIMTAEDPVEFTLQGVNQVQINERVGMTFAAALRSFLRQDPDVVLIGEMRDRETAEMAVKASLTGHLVLSTLHTNSAPAAIDRLVNMNIEPFLLASSLQLICAQRLVRRLCADCKEQASLGDDVLLQAGFSREELDGVKPYRARGCDACRGLGYRGRVGLYEVMEINEEISQLILGGGTLVELREAAERNGMMTLRQSGLLKVGEGVTSLEQVLQETAL